MCQHAVRAVSFAALSALLGSSNNIFDLITLHFRQRHGQGAQSAANRNQNKAGSQVFAGDPDTLRKKGLKRKGDTYISAEEFPWASTTAGGDSAVIAGVPLAQQHGTLKASIFAIIEYGLTHLTLVQKDALPKAWGAVGLSPTGKFTIKQFANAKYGLLHDYILILYD